MNLIIIAAIGLLLSHKTQRGEFGLKGKLNFSLVCA